MFKNIIVSIFLVFLSFLLVYLLADKIFLPYFLYKNEIQIPNIVGHNISTAKALLEKNDLDFNIQYIPSNKNDSIGEVIYSNPPFNKIIKEETIIELKVLGLRESYPVPDFKFKSKSVALNMLKSMNISIDTIIYDYWDVICTTPKEIDINNNFNQIMDDCIKYDKNVIWNQIPSNNDFFYKDDSITLFVSKGNYAPELYDVPILIDLNLNEAINLINESGLIIGEINYINSNSKKNKVIDQSPYGKSRISNKVNLTVQK